MIRPEQSTPGVLTSARSRKREIPPDLLREAAQRLALVALIGGVLWIVATLMEASVASEPDRIVHRLDLAYVYRDVHREADAKREFEKVLSLPSTDVNDRGYKAEAQSALK